MKISRWALILLVFLVGCVEPEAGHVKVILDDRVDGEPEALTKFTYLNPLHQQVYDYSTGGLSVTWKANPEDEEAEDWSLTFTTKEGAQVNVDLSVDFSFIPEKIPHLVKVWQRSQSRVIQGHFRRRVEHALKQVAAEVSLNDLYGPGRITFQNQLSRHIHSELYPEGFFIHLVTIAGEPRLPKEIQQAVRSRIVAEQQILQAEAGIAEKQAESAQAHLLAQSELDSARMWVKINRELSDSITPQLIQYLLLRKEQTQYAAEPTCSEVP